MLCNEKLTPLNASSPPSAQPENSCRQQQRPSSAAGPQYVCGVCVCVCTCNGSALGSQTLCVCVWVHVRRQCHRLTDSVCVCVCALSHVRLFVTPQTVACEAPLSMELSRQEYWSALPFPTLGYLPNPGIEPASPTSPCTGKQVLYQLNPQGSPYKLHLSHRKWDKMRIQTIFSYICKCV